MCARPIPSYYVILCHTLLPYVIYCRHIEYYIMTYGYISHYVVINHPTVLHIMTCNQCPICQNQGRGTPMGTWVWAYGPSTRAQGMAGIERRAALCAPVVGGTYPRLPLYPLPSVPLSQAARCPACRDPAAPVFGPSPAG